ncbi:MAG: K(+)-transporting ATPase subunit C [Pseudomonadota bacterium]
MSELLKELRISITAVLCLALLLCGLYPALVWTAAQILFPHQANGSLITVDGKVVGSELVGQDFKAAKYFHPRPSAAGDGYDPAGSGGSNLGPISRSLLDSVKNRVDLYRSENNLPAGTPVPVEAVTASASGLDPHISLADADRQAPRVAGARGVGVDAVKRMVETHTEGRDLGIFGQERVNVLRLNSALDGRP